MEKRVAIRYLIFGIMVIGLFLTLIILRLKVDFIGITGYAVYTTQDIGYVERGVYWNKIDKGGGNYNLEIYNAVINYNNGTEYEPISYGVCGSNCFRNWDGLIYKTSSDSQRAYIELYDVDGNIITKFGFGITGSILGANQKYSTLNFTWTWTQELDMSTNEYTFKAWNNRADFNWTQEFHFYPDQPMKIKNILVNNLGEDILNAKFWYIQTVGAEEGIWFNGTKYTEDAFKTGDFDSLMPYVKFEDDYIFDYTDLLANGFNITDFYLGDGEIIGVSGIRMLAIGVTRGSSTFSDGLIVTVDPTVKIGGSGNGEDVYFDKSTPNRNHGDKDYLKVQKLTWQRAYLKFNISEIPSGQVIDNASLCLFMYDDQGSNILLANHVYDDSWCEGDGGTDGSPACEVTWNNQPCGTENEYLNASNCNTTAETNLSNDGSLDDTWQCWNVTNMIKTEYASSNELVSIILWTIDSGNADFFHTKEYFNNSVWPYLNITYHTANTAPSMSLVLPQDGANYGNNESIELNFSVSDAESNIDSCWYSINNGNNITINNCVNTTFDVPGDGSYILNIYVNDSYGLASESSSNFSVQVGAPTIVLHSPINVYLRYNNIEFDYTPTDIDLDSCELWGNFTGSFGLNQTDTNVISGIVNSFNLDLEEGTHLWNIRCNDSLGNSVFNGNKTFYVDTTNPDLSISEPFGSKSSRTGIPLTFSVSDTNLESCWYNVEWATGGIVIANTSIVNCTNIVFDVSSDGNYVLNLFVNDSAGSSNYTSSSFSVTTSIPSPPSGGGGGGGGSVVLSLGKLELSQISNLIVDPGESKKLVLGVKNIGKIFLNDCKAKGKGENEGWIISEGIKGLSAGEEYDFIFTLNIPKALGAGSYNLELEVVCQESNESVNFSAEIIEKKLSVDLITVEKGSKEGVKIIYSLTELSGFDQEVRVEIVLFGENNERLAEKSESRKILAGSNKEFETILNNPENLAGSVNLLINAISDTSSAFVQEDIVLGDSKIGGLAILSESTRDIVFSVFFIAVFVVLAFFIIRRIFKLRKLKKKGSIGL